LIKIPIKFTGRAEVKGFSFTQILDGVYAYLYEVNTGDTIHYEVFKKRSQFLCIDFKKHIYSEDIKKEQYPNRNQFGVTALTFKDLDKATSRIFKLEKAEKTKQENED